MDPSQNVGKHDSTIKLQLFTGQRWEAKSEWRDLNQIMCKYVKMIHVNITRTPD